MAGGNLLQIDALDASLYQQRIRQDIQLPVNWHLSSDGIPASVIDNNELQTVMQAAFDSWQQLPTSKVQFVFAGEVDKRLSGIDGTNLITFTDQDFSFDPGVLGVALTFSFAQDTTITDANNDLDGDGLPDLANGLYPAGSIYESDIVFNSSYNFENTGVNGSTDLLSVAMHEIGHSVGLSHSVIDGAVMYPFLSADVASARILKADDIAFISHLYPKQPELDAAFGSISGSITNGINNVRVLGAHVYALDPSSGIKTVGAFSLGQGEYVIPGLAAGQYYVGIEPLDGVPTAADPKRINEVIANTLDTGFSEEFYDANESNIETDPLNAEVVTVTAGGVVSNINLVTNTVEVPGVSIVLQPGLNLLSYPVATADGFLAFDLLSALGTETEINSIDRYNNETGRFERAAWVNGTAAGENFPVRRGDAFIVHMQVRKVVVFKGNQDCPTVDTGQGFNLLGVPCPPAGYSAYDLLQAVDSAQRVKRYNRDTASFELAEFDGDGNPVGTDFPVINGEGYVVETLTDANGLSLPGKGQLFPPFLSGASPGRSVAGATITLTGQGFSTEASLNEVRFNGVLASVSFASGGLLTVTVPAAATTGPLNVTVDGRVSNSIDYTVESFMVTEASVAGKDLINGQTVQGEITADGEQDRYSFIATKDSFVSLSALSVVAGNPDLLLALEGPFGELLTSDDNSGGGTNPFINRYKLQKTGRYTAVVTSVPGSGTGAYTFNLNIEAQTSTPEISVLSGDFQSGLMGTELPNSLDILVTGATGQPISGVPVTIVTDDALTVSNGFTAASSTITTNGNGIVRVRMTLPNLQGDYSLDLIVPGFSPKRVSVASLTRLPAFVVKSGDQQNCGGDGCAVDGYLPEPYTLRFLDSDSQPLEGVLTKFVVAAGFGKVKGTGTLDSDENEVAVKSDVNGDVKVIHRMGQTLNDRITGLRLTQAVAAVASIPNSPGAILFQSTAKAGDPAKMVSLRTGFNQMTLGTSRLNAVHIKVEDEFGNPVSGAPVTMNGAPLQGAPGVLNGVVLPSMQTNDEGEFVGLVSTSNAPPTIDEFGGSIGSPYTMNVSVAGAGSQSYTVQVGMGPDLVGTTDNNGSRTGEAQWVGKTLGRKVTMLLLRMQRYDLCVDVDGDGNDDDQGDWTDEAHSVSRIRAVGISGVPINFTVKRTDNGEIDGNSITPEMATTNGGGYTAIDLTMGQARGGVAVTGKSAPTVRNFTTDNFCFEGTSDVTAGGVVIAPYNVPAKENSREQLAVSPKIEVTIKEPNLTEPNPDPLPSMTSYSGIDLQQIVINLNGTAIYDGPALSILSMNKYPNYIQASFDGAFITAISSQIVAPLSPGNFNFIYYPTASELNLEGQNTVQAMAVKDKVFNVEMNGTDEKIYEQPFMLP